MNLKKEIFTTGYWQDHVSQMQKTIAWLDAFLLYLNGLGVLVILYEIGFTEPFQVNPILHTFYNILFATVFLMLAFRTVLLVLSKYRKPSLFFEGILLAFMLVAVVARFVLRNQLTSAGTLLNFFESEQFIYGIIIYVFIVEVSKKTLLFYRSTYHPAQLFVLSFMFLILLGTGLLLLPQSTYHGISFIDALFTSTSAVCVTGLITVDTATVFTPTGKVIILLLIQIGALGIMTFASFFGIFFQGSSLKSALFMKDWLNEDNLSQITRTLFKIVGLSLGIELLGAALIYLSLQTPASASIPDQISFSIFHSISAFCNAGFSTLSLGLYDPSLRFNYSLQVIIAFLIILGGLGFPIMFALYRSLEKTVLRTARGVFHQREVRYPSRLLSVNTKLVLVTTLILLVGGSVVYFLLEYNNTLAEHSLLGKIAGSFFGAVTPRTAGFNTVDLAALTAPTVLLYLLLMWIGASPASVGGGIKTTSFAIAVLNIISLAKGKNRLEIYKREIEAETVNKAFAMIVLSLVVIGLSIFFVTLFNPELDLAAVAFESFSGFSTVGLSVGITSSLSNPSKVVIVLTMFLGRVGTLTLMVGLLRKVNTLRYRYPKESIIIT